MITLYQIRVEVPGRLGEGTVMFTPGSGDPTDRSLNEVDHFELEFEEWKGDSIVKAMGCYAVTEMLADDIQGMGLTGADFRPMAVSFSEVFLHLHKGIPANFPKFVRLVPRGIVDVPLRSKEIRSWSRHDICRATTGYMVVSERCLELLRRHGLNNCVIRPLELREIP